MQGRVDVSEASTQAGIRSCRSGTVRMAPSKVLIPTEVGHRFRNDAGRWFRFEVGHLFQPIGYRFRSEAGHCVGGERLTGDCVGYRSSGMRRGADAGGAAMDELSRS